MDKQTGPNGFLVVLPGEIIEIPQDSDKSWLTLFYSLPRELAEKWKPAYELPRCPYEVLRTDRYDHIVCDDMFKLLVWDCYAWSAWQFFQVKDRKRNYRDIPGNWNQYAGYFPLWRLSYSIIPYIRMKFEQNGLGFRAVMEQKLRLSSEAAIRGHKKRLAQAEKRLGELDRLFIRIYEDNVAGRITDEKFSMMSKTYEDEQAQLKAEIQALQQEIEVQERQIENLEQFIQRVRKYEDLDELTPYALRELVKAIYIEAPDKSSGKRHQGIRISYDLVGFIPVEELLKQEAA